MIFASFVAAVSLMLTQPSDPVVPTAQGPVVGRAADGIAAFKGIPYAAPPVGALRWKPPRPVEPWAEPRDAGRAGALCIQPPANGDPGVGPMPMSEDCLTLNVWSPTE